MDEIWKDIYFVDNGIEYDYRGLYQVSNLGRVKSLKRTIIRSDGIQKTIDEKILKLGKHTSGYLQITLCKDKKVRFFVHRLVAYMFIENDDILNKTQINHKDENKTNNCVYNLEWCTHKYNQNYGTKVERTTETYKNNYSRKNNPRTKMIAQYDLSGNLIKVWNSMVEIQEELNIKSSTDIRLCCIGKRITSHGYCWRYIKNNIIEEKIKIRNNLANSKIVQLSKDKNNVIKVWSSIAEASRKLNIKQQSISACCMKKRKSAGGFYWKYYEEENKNE